MDEKKNIKDEQLKDANGGAYQLDQSNNLKYACGANSTYSVDATVSGRASYLYLSNDMTINQYVMQDGANLEGTNTLEDCCQFANGSRLPNVHGCITNDQIVTNGTVTTNGVKLRNTLKNNISKNWVK